jgi:hypothetical protein
VGTPWEAATSGSRVVNSSGRAMSSTITSSALAMMIAVVALPALMPKIDPNSTVTLAAPLLVLAWVV